VYGFEGTIPEEQRIPKFVEQFLVQCPISLGRPPSLVASNRTSSGMVLGGEVQ
jgi:hypothetical protein